MHACKSGKATQYKSGGMRKNPVLNFGAVGAYGHACLLITVCINTE
jgi:hypothetical protein